MCGNSSDKRPYTCVQNIENTVDTRDAELGGDTSKPCFAAPCLFDVYADPEERHDVAEKFPDIVKAMQARIKSHYAPTEVTVADSGICPFVTYHNTDAGCCGMAARTGFWMPW